MYCRAVSDTTSLFILFFCPWMLPALCWPGASGFVQNLPRLRLLSCLVSHPANGSTWINGTELQKEAREVRIQFL